MKEASAVARSLHVATARAQRVTPSPGPIVAVAGGGRFVDERLSAALVAGGCTIALALEELGDVERIAEVEALEALISTHRRVDAAAVQGLRAIHRANPDLRLVAVVEREGGSEVRRALDAGVGAIVPIARLETALVPSLHAALAGQVVIPAAARGDATRQVLTTREKQILGLVVMGLTNAGIAGKLYLAESTVKSHLSSAFSKLAVCSRNEAVALILDPERGQGLGILTIPAERI